MKNFILIFIALFCFQVNAQVRQATFKFHDRGNLWETVKDDGTIGAPNPLNRFETYPSMDWPGGPLNLAKDDQRSYNYAAGMWIGGKKNDGTVFFNENGPFNQVDNGTFAELQKIDNFNGEPGFDPDEAEQTIVATWITTANIAVERRSKVWSYRGLNNFIIFEYTITNKNAVALNDVFVGFPYLLRPSYQDFLVHNGWGDDFNRADEKVGYDEARALLYSYDDTPNFSLPNDIGNYTNQNELNELRTTGYAGFAMLDAGEGNNSNVQPANVFWAQLLNNQQNLTTVNVSNEELYNLLANGDNALQASEDDFLVPFMLISNGPYNLNPEQTIKIVMVEAVAGLPQEEAIKGLDAQANLPAGLDSLKNTIDRARELYQNNYQLSSIAPPSPGIDIIPIPEKQSITISWDPVEDAWTDPINGTSKIAKFKIYKSDRSFIGPYKEIRTIDLSRTSSYDRYFNTDLNKWLYEDQSISLGAGYYYSVTAVDEDGNESWFTNRNEEAVFATNAPAENTLDVTVFPNPFKEISGFPTTGAENSIVWSNLPAECTIKIYTSNGELVKTMEHENSFSGEEIWNQLSDSRQQVAPGIYFWTVNSSVGYAKGTLLIIK